MKTRFRSFRIGVMAVVLCLSTVALARAEDAPKPDPSGSNTGGIADIVGASAGAPTAEEIKAMEASEPLAAKVADVVGKNRIAINVVWTLVCGFLVMFMQAGFAMAETGFTRAKNAGHTMAMNFMVYVLGMLGYWVCRLRAADGRRRAVRHAGRRRGAGRGVRDHALRQGVRPLRHQGASSWPATATTRRSSRCSSSRWSSWTPRPPSPPGPWPNAGTSSRSWSTPSSWARIIYPLYANWVWGGGWLSKLGSNFGLGHGHVDFAGSSVVHMTGGVLALVGAKMLGPRIGKFTKDGTPIAIPGHHLPMVIVGCFILAFGWFGFNAGSTLAGTDLRIAVVAVNTMLAGVRRRPSPRCSTRGCATASRTSACRPTACWPGWSPSPRRAPSSPRRRPSSSALIAGVLSLLGRGVRRAHAEDRRPGRRHLRARRQRRLGRARARALRRRQLRRRPQRRDRARSPASSTAMPASWRPSASALRPTSSTSGRSGMSCSNSWTSSWV